MRSDEIRETFINFFSARGHKIFPSDSLIPKDDPTVLFTSAGMNQFKPYFLCLKKDVLRAASCQKCLRTDDLEKVGKTPGHHTFFEMLGNFSFGDYFKKEAILWAWEFITEVVKLLKEKIWVSVYEDDSEAYQIWTQDLEFPRERIVRLGGDKNFWPANALKNGPDGPCGPCSEIFYDLGQEAGCGRLGCQPGCDCGRFVEIWNLVFTQYNRKEKNGQGILEPLPNKNIDTGMGLERLASVLQGVKTNFEIDIFKPIVNEILALVAREKVKVNHLYAISDHARAITFAICDGVFPSNEESGYVVRKIIRKAIWHGYKIGLHDLFLYKLVPIVVSVMKTAYPELESRRENIAQIVKAEEERFQNTLNTGLSKLHELMQELKRKDLDTIPGEKIFQLYDTYGFPVELTNEIAHENNFKLDLENFYISLDVQRKRSKAKSGLRDEIFSKEKELLKELPETEFIGYDFLEAESALIAIFDIGLTCALSQAKEGEEVIFVTKTSPFYPEAGGQVGDRGLIYSSDFKASVLDTKVRQDRILHFVKIDKGIAEVNQVINLKVDPKLRLDTARNHTATHILQAVLRQVLGKHVEQSGSYVGPERLRFDFTHFQALSKNEINWIEEKVNEFIMDNDEVTVRKVSYQEAMEMGALAFFKEKYQEIVRVVEIGSYSKELCGGTHLKATGGIGLFKIVSESSCASGIRRIEATTGKFAYNWVKQQEELINEISSSLQVDSDKILSQLRQLFETIHKQEQFIKSRVNRELDTQAQKLIHSAEKIKNIAFVCSKIDREAKILADLIDKVKDKSVTDTAIVLYSIHNTNILLVIGLTPGLIEKGLDARQLVKKVSKLIKGGGGGRPDFVQAGGKEVSKINEVIKVIKEEIELKLR